MQASGRSLTEKIGTGLFVFGVSLAGFADGIYTQPKTVRVLGLLSGIVIASGGLLTWAIGRHLNRR